MFAKTCVVLALACAVAVGQTPAAAKAGASANAQVVAPGQFDAVSIKPSGPQRPAGVMFGITPSGFVTNHQPLIAVDDDGILSHDQNVRLLGIAGDGRARVGE